MSAATVVETFLAHIEHDRAEAAIDLVLDRVHEGAGVCRVVREVLAPAQRTVGERWAAARYTVADEHRASAVVDDLLGLLVPHAPRTGAHPVPLACAEGEWHTTPARMAALCLRDAGWRVQLLGGSLPADHLDASLAQLTPHALAVSCTLPLALPGVAGLVEVAHRRGVPVVVGGAAVAGRPRRAEILGADAAAAAADQAARILTGWLDAPPGLRTAWADADVEHERARLDARREAVVAAVLDRLTGLVPEVAGYDARRRFHTRQDLDTILRFADVALRVDDVTVLTDLVQWLAELLERRGVPPGVLEPSLTALADGLGDDLPRTHRLLDHARGAARPAHPGEVTAAEGPSGQSFA